MGKYIEVISAGEWVNGSGWSYDSTVDANEVDTPNLDTNDIDWYQITGISAMDFEDIQKKADADLKDIRWKIAIYNAAEYEECGDAAELASVEKWESEIASEYLEMYAE